MSEETPAKVYMTTQFVKGPNYGEYGALVGPPAQRPVQNIAKTTMVTVGPPPATSSGGSSTSATSPKKD